jgi:hypothetical protein
MKTLPEVYFRMTGKEFLFNSNQNNKIMDNPKHVEIINKTLEEFLQEKVDELISTGNKNKFHFVDIPSSIEVSMNYKYAKTDTSGFDPSTRIVLGIKLIVEYNGYVFMLRDL